MLDFDTQYARSVSATFFFFFFMVGNFVICQREDLENKARRPEAASAPLCSVRAEFYLMPSWGGALQATPIVEPGAAFFACYRRALVCSILAGIGNLEESRRILFFSVHLLLAIIIVFCFLALPSLHSTSASGIAASVSSCRTGLSFTSRFSPLSYSISSLSLLGLRPCLLSSPNAYSVQSPRFDDIVVSLTSARPAVYSSGLLQTHAERKNR